jgi:two-component system, NtrC family, nitrogen regulation sensor histidine kinase NtrY
VTLRRLFLAYLVVLHALLAVLLWTLLRDEPWWLLAAEGGMIVSVVAGSWLMSRLVLASTLVAESAVLLEESDYTTRFRPTGQEEIDRLIDIYNRMVDALRAERVRVREQHHFLQRVLEVSPSGAVILDHDDRVSMLNPAAIRLLGGSTRIGDAAAQAGTALGDVLGQLQHESSAVVTLPGARRVKVSRGTFMDRGFSRTFVLIEELTEELRRAEKSAYEKLIRMLSHEVNNSVAAANSLLTSSMALAEGLPSEERADLQGALQVVIGRTAQLGAFMKAFADVVRLPEPRRAACDVADLLRQLQRLMSAEAEHRGIEWHLVLEPLPDVLLDRAMMEQALVNVLKNAMEAIGEGGRITLRTGTRDDRPFLQVEDSGPGLDPEARAHLFTPFFSTKEAGQGIGLTLVAEILTRHEFAFSLDSDEGGPTTFTIWLDTGDALRARR